MTENVEKTIMVNGRRVPMSTIKGIECIFSTYVPNKFLGTDALIAKEKVHYNDGTVENNLRIHRDRKWPYYITREGFRNHNDIKEWEDMSRLERRFSTHLDLPKNISRALNGGFELPMKQLSDSPYLYGTDVSPATLLKDMYRKRWQGVATVNHDVAALDTETNMFTKDEEIIISNIVYKNKSYTAVTKDFVGKEKNFVQRVRDMANELMQEDIERLNLEWEIEIVDNAGEAVWNTLQRAHAWQPDFISIWNMNFDIPKMVQALEMFGYDPRQAFSDPRVPEEYKYFYYKEGNAIKVNQEGKKTPLHPAERWHDCRCAASFWFIDSMCLYKRIRTAAGNEAKYTLDYILSRNKLSSKLKLKELEHLETDGGMWHQEAQQFHKVFYTVYNLRDDIALIDLDNKVGDITRAFPALVGVTDFFNFNKTPRMIADDLHFFVQQYDKVIGTRPSDIKGDPLNAYVLGMGQWIITLPAYMMAPGMRAFEDAPHIQTMIYRYLADLDISSTYPTGELILNISRETTVFETSLFEGFTEQERRYFGLTLTSGKSSALELGIRYFGFPSPEALLQQYDKDMLPNMEIPKPQLHV